MVAHFVTGIVVQAQAARVVADRDPRAADWALEQIEGAGKDALAAMRGMVGSLRDTDGANVAATIPPVGLSGLEDLAVRSGLAGLPVHVRVEGRAEAVVRGAAAASTHRIVQESLTNVHRHAEGATRAEVDVRLDGNTLVVTVSDDGRQPVGDPDRTPPGAGFGLVGMAAEGRGPRRRPRRRAGCAAGPRLARTGVVPPRSGVANVTIRVVLADDQEMVRTGFRHDPRGRGRHHRGRRGR